MFMNQLTNHEIVCNGTFYYPANKHYNGQGTVTCDRCGQENLDVCVGYEKMDLCLSCVDSITKDMKNRHLGIAKIDSMTKDMKNQHSKIAKIVYSKYKHNHPEVLDKVIVDVLKRMTSAEFKNDPVDYLRTWKQRRGCTEELRMPEDLSYQVIEEIYNNMPSSYYEVWGY